MTAGREEGGKFTADTVRRAAGKKSSGKDLWSENRNMGKSRRRGSSIGITLIGKGKKEKERIRGDFPHF